MKGQHFGEPVTQGLSADEEVKHDAESESVSSSKVIAFPIIPLALCETVQITLQLRPDNTAKNESHFL